MVVPGMETLSQYQAAQFRVALLLKKYRFGAVSAAKYLGKPRGLVQSWMQIGSKHYLAKEKIKLKSFEKILKELRKKITKEHMNYFLAKRLASSRTLSPGKPLSFMRFNHLSFTGSRASIHFWNSSSGT